MKFDSEQYIEDLENALKVILEESAREWLRAVVKRVPVWSGEARGSLLPLSRYLDEQIVIEPVVGVGNGIVKGERESRFQFKFEKGEMAFIFDQLVPHYLINDFNVGLGQPPLIHPTPWHSLKAGEIAFKEHLQQSLKDAFPKRLLKYFKF